VIAERAMRGLVAVWIWVFCGLAPLYAAGIYKWTDEKGVVHYGERPPANARTQTTEVKGVQGRVSETLKSACAHLKSMVPGLLVGMRSKQTRGDAMADAGEADAQLRNLGLDDANLRKLVDLLYNYGDPNEHGYVSGNRYYGEQGSIEQMDRAQAEVHQRCLAGAFGQFDPNARERRMASAGGHDDPAQDGPRSSGTGFFVGRGIVATNWHVVKDGQHIEVVMDGGTTQQATVLTRDEEHDLALLSVMGAGEHPMLQVAGEEASLGLSVFTLGFPQIDIMGTRPKLATGVISSLSGIRDDPRTYQISVPVQAGNSGGPLIDDSGRVVGIVAAKLNAAQVFQWTGDLPQNVNYAIKSAHLSALLGRIETMSTHASEPRWVSGAGVQALAPQVQAAVVRLSVR
jgi:S1-C subfamily serine protease